MQLVRLTVRYSSGCLARNSSPAFRRPSRRAWQSRADSHETVRTDRYQSPSMCARAIGSSPPRGSWNKTLTKMKRVACAVMYRLASSRRSHARRSRQEGQWMTGRRRLRRWAARRVQTDVTDRLLHGLPNPSRYRLRKFAEQAAAQGSSKDFRVLDAGAGKAPFRRLFDHLTYETADFGQVAKKAYAPIDYRCDLTTIPVPDSTYDLVSSTQVLDHVPDPVAVLRERHRVLKPGGQAWLTAPLFFAEHEKPYDFHRFTQFAWQRMATETGFTVKEITWLE